jgi:PPM family protein phosphatase
VKTRHALEYAGNTDPGKVRKNNEDSFLIDEELGLVIVADGMGGHNSGEVASLLAVETIRDQARKLLGGERSIVPDGTDPTLSVRGRQLEHCVKTANTIIYEKGRAMPKDAGMGTTVVAVLFDDRGLTVAHVGDSRLYLFRGGALETLTEDHSLVADQVRRGLITPEDAAKSNLQNILTRALGAESDVKVDVADHPLLPDDLALVATDGLTKMMTDAEIAKAAAAEAAPGPLVQGLIRRACEAGGVDNVTVAAVLVRGKASTSAALQGIMSRIFGK